MAENHRRTVEVNRAVALVARQHAELIAGLRRKQPRLDADGVSQAAARFRRRIGSNRLLWSLGELDPSVYESP